MKISMLALIVIGLFLVPTVSGDGGGWWNSTMTRFPILSIDNATGLHYINDSYGVDSGTGLQYISCYINDWTETAYAYNDTNDTWYCANSTTQFSSFIDEGNGTNYGDFPDEFVTMFSMGYRSGTTMIDFANNYNGTIAGTPVFSDMGAIGESMICDGINDNFQVNHAATDGLVAGTIMFWINKTVISGYILRAWKDSDEYLMFETSPAEIILSHRNGVAIRLAQAVDSNVWTHVAYVWNSSGTYAYFNGTMLKSTGLHVALPTTTNNLFVCSHESGGYMTGGIDDFRTYNEVIDGTEINRIYKNTKPVGYWMLGTMETYAPIPPPPPPPPPPPIPIHSFIIYKLINSQIPVIGNFLETLTFQSIILFMDRLTVLGNIDIGGNINVTGNVTGNQIRGEMSYHNHTATPLDFASDGVYYNLSFDSSLVNGFTFNNSEDYLEPLYSGIYLTNYMASGSGQNNHIYYTDITVNGVVVDKCESHKKMSAGGDIVTMYGSCHIELSAGDKVKLVTADIGGTGIGNFYSANLNLVRIGD